MRFTPSIFASLLKPIDRNRFATIVARHEGDAYDKAFDSWRHLVTLVFAQLTGASSLRAIAASFNAQSNHHYHLGCRPIARSTLADANRRRPVAVFADVLADLACAMGRRLRRETKSVLHLIDATPVPLSRLFDCAASNGRIHGLKLHVLYDPDEACPKAHLITPANVNDIAFARGLIAEPGVTYVFDKAYCHFGWWASLDAAGAFFVTRPKTSMRWKTRRPRRLGAVTGEGFTVIADREVSLASKGDSRLPVFLRRITIRRDSGEAFDIITNDSARSAVELAHCYKARWQIELLFRWIKQTLNIRKFMAFNENAVRLQILAAMIAFVLISIARRQNAVTLPKRRFAELIAVFIHTRRSIATIEKPPPNNPVRRKPRPTTQIEFKYD